MKRTLSQTLAVILTVTVAVSTFSVFADPAEMSNLKPRIVVLTDIAPNDCEPDDLQSLVRLFVHADLYEIEALIASSGWNNGGRPYPKEWMEIMQSTIDAYKKDVPNLMKRSNQTGFLSLTEEASKQQLGYWPSAEYLRSRSMMGSLEQGVRVLGTDNHSPGSNMIIQLVDEDDERPLWIAAWGGGNTLAQAIWKVKQERTEEQLKTFLNKICFYTITDQDVTFGERHSNYPFSSHHWMRSEFEKSLMFFWDESAWLSQNAIGRTNWKEYAAHIQNHGHLGKIYPKYKYGVEGDTPSFLHLMPNGLNDPKEPKHVGWGGYFQWGLGMDKTTHSYTNHEGNARAISQKYEAYFYPATFNNFAARMDWAKDGKGNRNPVVVVNGNKGSEILKLSPKQGETIELDASETSDPDGDSFVHKWWVLPESGTYTADVHIMNTDRPKAEVLIPVDAAGKTIHIICEVTDTGTPPLSQYRRVIVKAVP